MRKLTVLRDPSLIARELQGKTASPHAPGIRPRPQAPQRAPRQPEPVQVDASPILEQVTRAKHQAETDAILAALTPLVGTASRRRPLENRLQSAAVQDEEAGDRGQNPVLHSPGPQAAGSIGSHDRLTSAVRRASTASRRLSKAFCAPTGAQHAFSSLRESLRLPRWNCRHRSWR